MPAIRSQRRLCGSAPHGRMTLRQQSRDFDVEWLRVPDSEGEGLAREHAFELLDGQASDAVLGDEHPTSAGGPSSPS